MAVFFKERSMRKARVAFTLAAVGGLWLGCSKDNAAPNLEGTWLVSTGALDSGAISPSSFTLRVWASADTYIVSMPMITWSGGPTTYNARPGVVVFAGGGADTLSGFYETASGFGCAKSLQLTGSVHAAKDTLFNAQLAIVDSFNTSTHACYTSHTATATAHKVGSAGALPTAAQLKAGGTWHIAVGTLTSGTIAPDTFTLVIGGDSGSVSVAFPTLTWTTGGSVAYDTFAVAYAAKDSLQGWDHNHLGFIRSPHNAVDAQTCRGVDFEGEMNARPDSMTGTLFVLDSTGTKGCYMGAYAPFTGTKGP
jgi:hypothetical protein